MTFAHNSQISVIVKNFMEVMIEGNERGIRYMACVLTGTDEVIILK